MKETGVRQAKVTDDAGYVRSKVPVPILKAIGAKPGDYLRFEMDGAGQVVVKLVKKAKKSKR